MMKLQVLDINGNVVKDVSLNEKVWNIMPHQQAMFDATIAQQASWRQGTHQTKTRGEVSGGGKKPWKQKGTGRARQGSIRSPQWKGGGIVFGPTVERNYKLHVNRKVRKLALKSALSLKAQNNELIIVDSISLEKYSTKAVLQICQNLKLVDNKTLLITKVADEMIVKSASNIAKFNVIAANNLNIYDLLHANKLLITLEALVNIEGVLA